MVVKVYSTAVASNIVGNYINEVQSYLESKSEDTDSSEDFTFC